MIAFCRINIYPDKLVFFLTLFSTIPTSRLHKECPTAAVFSMKLFWSLVMLKSKFIQNMFNIQTAICRRRHQTAVSTTPMTEHMPLSLQLHMKYIIPAFHKNIHKY